MNILRNDWIVLSKGSYVAREIFKQLKRGVIVNQRLIWFLCCVLVAGCYTAPIKHGNEFDTNYVKHIVKGETTRAQLITWFGQPYLKSTISENEEKWVYTYTQGEAKSGVLSTKVNSQTNVLDIYIKEDVVINYTYNETKDTL